MHVIIRKYRGTLAVAALVFSIYSSGLSAVALQGLYHPGMLAAILPESLALRCTLFVIMELGGLVLFSALFLGGWAMWLVLMKPLYSRSEMSAYLGFELQPQSRLKRAFKRVFNLIY